MILAAIALAICPPGPHDNCVVDGDTLWLAGEKIRIADIDAPELHGRCARESALARQARSRLLVLLNSAPFRIRRIGKDRYGRTLAVILSARGSIGDQLVAEGLAQRWRGRKARWCGQG